MKQVLLVLMLAFGSTFVYSEISQVYDMKEIIDYVDKNISDKKANKLVIFDIDMVLVQPEDPAFQMPNMKKYSAVSKRIMGSIPSDKHILFLSLMSIGSNSILIDDRVPRFLSEISGKGIPVMALTANLTGTFGTIKNMEQWKLEGLRKLGIDFSKIAPCYTSFVLEDLPSYRGNYSMYVGGILFVNGSVVSKGDAFASFLKKTKLFFNEIIFVDDREENLKSLEASLKKIDASVAYKGFHFLGAQKYPSKSVSEEEFASRWNELALLVDKMD